MKILNLKHFLSFRQERTLNNLNELVERQKELMPHQVAVASGCTVDEAMGILMLLTVDKMAEAYLLIYHILDDTDPPVPILARRLTDGFPEIPFVCDNCEREITDTNELRYDFLFKIGSTLRFTYLSE